MDDVKRDGLSTGPNAGLNIDDVTEESPGYAPNRQGLISPAIVAPFKLAEEILKTPIHNSAIEPDLSLETDVKVMPSNLLDLGFWMSLPEE